MHLNKPSQSISLVLFSLFSFSKLSECIPLEIDPIVIKSCLSNPPDIVEWVVVNPEPTDLDDYGTLHEPIINGDKYIYLSEGTYLLSRLEIYDLPVVIVGASKEKTIVQLSEPGAPLFWIQSHDVIICNLSIDTYSVNGAYVEQEKDDYLYNFLSPAVGCFYCESVILRNLIISGTQYASVLQFSSMEIFDYKHAYQDKRFFGYDNVIENVTIFLYGNGKTATIEFDLQKRGRISNNSIRSAFSGLAIFLSDDTECTFNSFLNTVSTAISVFLPSKNIKIENNQIFYAGHIGIEVIPPEQIPDDEGSYSNQYRAQLINISNNHMQKMQKVGIAVSNTIEATVSDNIISDVSNHGIYLSESQGAIIRNNYISLNPKENIKAYGIYGSGLVLDSSILNNSVLTKGTSEIQKSGIEIHQGALSNNNRISMNLVSGTFLDQEAINFSPGVNDVKDNICDTATQN